MARMKSKEESRLEYLEGLLGCLGNARVYLRLVRERVQVAARVDTADMLLGPALDDLGNAERLIVRVQEQIGDTVPVGRGPWSK